MAGELVLFGVQKLWDLLNQEYAHFQGVNDQVDELKSDLNLLNSFLKDADAKKHTSAMVRNCVEEIKGIICDAEDIIETFLIKEKFEITSGIKKHIKRLSWVVPSRREIAFDIGGISKKLNKVISVMQSFGIQQIVADDRYMQPLHNRQWEMRQEFARDNESNLVGLEANVKKLVGYLVEKDNEQVIFLTGMGGLGKTTLARQAFNNEMVKNNFELLAWVCVSQVVNRKTVWQTILQSFRPKEEKKRIMEMTKPTLQDELFRLLETSKSLIVLDDIWKKEDWDLIKPIFPSKTGWKVLLTSRNESIAMHEDTTYINFKPECLTIEDSWTLFQKIALTMKDTSEVNKDDKEMEELGMQMIKHCGGLPLAIRVLGGFLAAKYTLHDWKRVQENIGSHLVGRIDPSDDNTSSNFYHVLSLSFEELPSYLKHCFLYLAHFPEDFKIDVGELSYYWAAEGIPRPKHYDGATIRDVADGYIEELVKRNMVISERDVTTSRFEICHLHDTMREICLVKAEEENFLQIGGIRSLNAKSQCRRFACQYPTTLAFEINNQKLRSLLIFLDDSGNNCMQSGLSFTKLQLLRVLDLFGVKFEGGKIPPGIGNLIHLRYLRLEGVEASRIPSSLRNLKLLIYLNLDVLVSVKAIFVPNILMEMQDLRCLVLPMFMHEKTKLDLSNLVKLETLKNFSTENSSLEDLSGMVRLMTLKIILTEDAGLGTLSASIFRLKHLESLAIMGCGIDRKVENNFFFFYLENLKYLSMSIYIPRLPYKQNLPSRLATISLYKCFLEEDPMPILEKLLHLKDVNLRYQSFCGMKMVCSVGGFPKLQTLALSELLAWEEWIIEEGSMPILHTLKIGYCIKLKKLPDGLKFITSLKEMRVFCMGMEWKKRLSQGGEDYNKVQHISSVRIISGDDN